MSKVPRLRLFGSANVYLTTWSRPRFPRPGNDFRQRFDLDWREGREPGRGGAFVRADVDGGELVNDLFATKELAQSPPKTSHCPGPYHVV